MSAFLSALDLIDRATGVLGLSDDRAPSRDAPSQDSAARHVLFHNDVAALLDTGDESLLQQSLTTLRTWGQEPAAAPSPALHEEAGLLQDTIWEAADWAATNLRVVGSPRLPDGWIVPTLIPLTIVAPPDAPIPEALDAAVLQRLTTAWHNHPIGQPPHRLLVMPRLYTAPEIPGTWAGQRQWLQQFRVHFSGAVDDLLQIPALAPSSAHRPAAVDALPPAITVAPNGERLTLRFLAVASFQPDDGLPAFDLDAYAHADQALPDLLLPILDRVFPTASLIAIGEPGAWDEALDTAIAMHNAEGLALVFGGDAPVPLVVHGHVIGPAVIWDLLGPQTLRHLWIVRDDPLEELSELLRALDALHVTDLQVVLPVHALADCPWTRTASASP